MKGCERCFHTLQQGIIRGAVRDGNRAERGGAGGNSAGSRISEGIVDVMAEEVTSEWNRSSTYAENRRFSLGEKNGEKYQNSRAKKKSAAQKQREQDAAVQRSWFHRIGSGADSYHKVCKKC